MKTNATLNQLTEALAEVNKQFDNNITFKRLDQSGKGYIFTLTVKDSKKAGSRKSATGRRHATVNNWIDWNIGSRISPFYYSEACNC